MEWRCTFCGKPHAEDDPPCDNCGHNKFERAVEQFNAETVPSDPIWVCTECGRQHQKHSPPCSRCGNVTLEKRQPDYDDLDDLGGTSYLDVLEPKYVVGFLAAGLFLIVLALSATGVVDVLGVNDGNTTVRNVPGNGTTAGGLSLADVEAAYLDEINDRRAAAGYAELERDEWVANVTSYVNKRRVKAEYADGSTPSERQREESFGDACSTEIVHGSVVLEPDVTGGPALDAFDSERALGVALVDQYLRKYAGFTEPIRGVTGVDVHVAPDGAVYALQYYC